MTEKQCDKFLLMWDMYGLESIINISEMERQAIDDTLHDRPVKSPPLNVMLLRARFNSQRHYEIYIIETEFTEDEIVELFASDPQNIVDAIRRIGVKIHSDLPSKDVVIK